MTTLAFRLAFVGETTSPHVPLLLQVVGNLPVRLAPPRSGPPCRPMSEPTVDDIDALVGPATPQFAFQIRARVREAIDALPDDDPVRRYGEQQMELLDRLGYASTKAENSEPESRERIGWETIPSSRPHRTPCRTAPTRDARGNPSPAGPLLPRSDATSSLRTSRPAKPASGRNGNVPVSRRDLASGGPWP